MTGMIEKLNSLLQKKKISCIELTRAYLNGIARDNGVLKSVLRKSGHLKLPPLWTTSSRQVKFFPRWKEFR
mgnify:CR=1 FL=1